MTNHPPRIAMLGSMPPLRGISSYCLELAASVSRHCPVEFISFKSMYPRPLYPGGSSQEDDSFPEVETPRLRVRRKLAWYAPWGWVWEGVRSRAEVMHAQHWSLPLVPIYATILALCKLRGTRIVLTVHNVEPHENGRLYVWATRALCRLADRVILHTDENCRRAREVLQVPAAKLTKIRHGVLGFLEPGDVDRAGARQRLGLPDAAPVVLCFGAIRRYKGVDVLIRAFARVASEMPEAVLVLSGKPWGDWAPYQALIDRFGIGERVKALLDYVPSAEVKHHFHAADLVVLPYRHFDAQSGVALASLAFGKPMIVTDVGGLPELVLNRTCVVPPSDEEALAERILLCLRDDELRAQLAADAREVARSHSWDEIAAETVSLYKELCANLTHP